MLKSVLKNCRSKLLYLKLQVVALLLQAGADPNAKDSWSYTPLHEAAVKGKIDVCIMLLQHGADPSIRNSVSQSENKYEIV